MLGSAILETVIGVVFIVVLFSTVCTAVREWIESLLKTRAAYLEYGIRELLNDKKAAGLVNDLYTHPLIAGLFVDDYRPAAASSRPWFLARRRNLPSYIPAKNFAAALLDIAVRGPVNTTPVAGQPLELDLAAIRAQVLLMDNEPVARALLNAIDLSEGKVNGVIHQIEAWFDSSMDRVSGWYKRLSSRIVFMTALLLAVLLDVDLIRITNQLYNDEGQRTMLVAYAQSSIADPAERENRKAAFERLKDKSFPVGREGDVAGQIADASIWNWTGWIVTAFAATLGAPFWFDVLNRVMVIRSTVKPHEKSKEERSQDN